VLRNPFCHSLDRMNAKGGPSRSPLGWTEHSKFPRVAEYCNPELWPRLRWGCDR
jgi:hypothetical protein